MYTDEFLMHYGRKGMKWGQHIYGKERVVSKKSRRNMEDHEAIYKTLNKKQREFLTGGQHDPRYFVKGYPDYKYSIYKQKLLKIGKTPMSFVDAWGRPTQKNGEVSLTIATNSKHQGKGYASRLLREMVNDLKLDTKVSEIIYLADVNNKASNKTALSVGLDFLEVINHEANGVTDTYNVYHYKKG